MTSRSWFASDAHHNQVMEKLRTLSQRIQFSERTIPIIFLLVLFLSFGLVISSLGIYQDDWVFVYNAYVRGSQGLWAFLNADGTPFSSLMNISLFNLLGVKPLYWHVAELIARWLTVIAFWLVLRQMWPEHPLQNFTVSLFFAVYPFFTLQPLAFTYLHIWISYLLLGFSIYWMVLSVQRPDKFWLYLFLSLAAGIVSELTAEYFMGLEFLRPVILWFVLRTHEKEFKSRWIKTLKRWLPYLIVFGTYVVWRFFIYQVPIENRNDPVVVKLFLSNPIAGIMTILANLIPDVLSIVVASWYKVLDPLFFNFTDRTSFLFIALSVFVGVALFWVYNHYTHNQNENTQPQSTWTRDALGFGIIILVLGLIPPYAGGLFINEKNPLWNSRFGLASMLGAALIVVALLELISPKVKTRLVLIAVMIGLSVGYHARYTNTFRWAWKKELNLYRQLKTRIPSLQPGTAIIADEEILFYMGDYPTAYAINTIYKDPFTDTDQYIDYWFFGITTNFGDKLDEFMGGTDIDATHRSMNFIGRSDQSIIVSFKPDQGECLHVIRPQDASFRKLEPLLKQASHLSALDQINSSTEAGSGFLEKIGAQYPEDWCTYYQKADLARQNEDYEKVIDLWQEARQKNFSPGSYFEYFPFLESYIQLQQWDRAENLTREAIREFPIAKPTMCDYWNALPASAEKDAAFGRLQSKLDCFFPPSE